MTVQKWLTVPSGGGQNKLVNHVACMARYGACSVCTWFVFWDGKAPFYPNKINKRVDRTVFSNITHTLLTQEAKCHLFFVFFPIIHNMWRCRGVCI